MQRRLIAIVSTMMHVKAPLLIAALLATGCSADVGEACGENQGFGAHSYLECEEGAFCHNEVGYNEPICLAHRKLGESCEKTAQCPKDTQCFIPEFSIDKALNGVCKVRQKEGEPCRWSEHAMCDDKTFCLDGKCTKKYLPEYSKCYVGVADACIPPLYCFPADRDDPVVSYEDLPGFDRNNGICKSGGIEGEKCNNQWDIGCAPGFECFGDFCIKKENR